MSINGNSSEKVLISAYLIIALFFILTIRIWQLQILQGSEYRKLSEENRLRILRVAAPRGIIYDRNGIPLVKNTPYYFVSISPQNLDGLDISVLAELLKMDRDFLSEKIKNRPQQNLYEPIRLKEGLSPKEIALIEARRSDFPSLAVDVDVSRDYLFGNIGAHLIGYLGKPNEFQYNSPDFRDVPSNAFIGQWGVERLYDRQLRGTSGEKIIEMDALGRELRLIKEKSPVRGDDVKLAMDIRLQKEAEESFGEKTGALVAMKPDTGEILALISKPSFDPNLFARGIKYRQWEELTQNKKLPLLNRSLQSQYPPGSTFKIITAIAAMEEGSIDVNTKVTCTGEIVYGRWHFGCWQKHGHGTLSLHRALVESCDVYFYNLAERIGVDRIAAMARALGLGQTYFCGLGGQKDGLIPTTGWKRAVKGDGWLRGETILAGIGQGYVLATPLQLAVMTARIATGRAVVPTLMRMAQDQQPARPLFAPLNIAADGLDAVRAAMVGAVHAPDGTGGEAIMDVGEVLIAGKTGTSQVWASERGATAREERYDLRDHALFVSFFPATAPRYAIALVVEHGGSGGRAAAPLVRDISRIILTEAALATVEIPGSVR